MKTLKGNLLSAALVVLGLVVVAALYSRMPDPVPTHWGIHGEVNGWMPKPWGPFLLPLTNLGLLVMMLLLPRISPRGFEVDRFAGALSKITLGIVAFMFGITVIASLAAIGVAIDMNLMVSVGCGALFVVIGNFMGKLTKNFFIGIRTPWTLASDEVWLRTHRLGGKLFVAAGLASIAGALLGHGIVTLVASLVVVSLTTIIYSYVVHERLNGTSGAV